jgi:beta-1,4-N-acetylglucosaminyltransferase
MILVTVGTTDFDDLLRAMDALAPTLGEEIVAQTGRGRYAPLHMEHFDFAPSLEPYYRRARLVVAHGGLGTAIEVLDRGLKLIGVSNPDRYDHHQDDILRTLSERGHMLWCRRLDELPQALANAASTTFAPYTSPPCRIAEVIRDYILTGKVTKLSD